MGPKTATFINFNEFMFVNVPSILYEGYCNGLLILHVTFGVSILAMNIYNL